MFAPIWDTQLRTHFCFDPVKIFYSNQIRKYMNPDSKGEGESYAKYVARALVFHIGKAHGPLEIQTVYEKNAND
jgi:hypothetical protein